MHRQIAPSILYLGTPVLLVGTLNLNGSANLAPMSSAWWLGWNCMLGLGAKGHTSQNLLEAVLEASHPFGRRPDQDTSAYAFEVRVVRAHVGNSLLVAGTDDHVDPDA